MRANEKPVDPAWLLMSGVILTGTLCLYLLLVSDWYWNCRAQIDPVTLTPPLVCKSPPMTSSFSASQPPNGEIPFELGVWPDFGSGNKNYDDVSLFWGNDFVSSFFETVLDIAARVARPFVVDQVVPSWNRAMGPKINRQALYTALSMVLGALTTEWAKDVYYFLRKLKRKSVQD